jgi:large repetitive protein
MYYALIKNYYLYLFLFSSLFLVQNNFAQGCSADAGTNQTICAGGPAQLSGSGTINGGGTPTYTWSPSTGLNDPSIPNPVASPTVTTTYTLTVSGSGCNSTDQVTITVNPVPTASFTFSPNNQCANIPVNFTNTSTGTGLSYNWDFGNPASGSANTSIQTNPNHEFMSIGSGTESFTVNLIVTNAAGCSASASQNVTVNQTPGPSLIDPITEFKNCDGSGSFEMTAFNTTTSSAVSNYTIEWGDGTANFSNATFPGGGVVHTYTTQDIFNLLFIVTGNNGCIDTAIVPVGNITNPAIGAANPGGTTGCGPLELCFPLSNYSTNHISTYYVVNYGDGSPNDTINHPPPTTLCHTYTQSSCGGPGNAYTFSMQAFNLCDNSLATISPIRVYTGPTAGFTPSPNPGCVGSPITFLNNSVLGFNSTCANTTIFNWDFGDGTTLTQFALGNPTHTYAAPGTYTVTLSTQNACGTTVDTKTVCIEAPPVPDFTITPQEACVPFNAATNDLSIIADVCNVTYNWQVLFNGSTCLPSSGVFNFINGTDASSEEPQFQFVDPGQYTVRLTLTNSCGSFFFDQIVTAKASPIASLNPLVPICAGASITPIATVNECYDSPTTYLWNFSGSGSGNSSDLVPDPVTYSTDGNYTVSFSVTNSCGTTTATTPLIVNAAPSGLVPSVNSPICEGATAQFETTEIIGATYSWTGPNGFSSTLQNPIINSVTAASGAHIQ